MSEEKNGSSGGDGQAEPRLPLANQEALPSAAEAVSLEELRAELGRKNVALRRIDELSRQWVANDAAKRLGRIAREARQ